MGEAGSSPSSPLHSFFGFKNNMPLVWGLGFLICNMGVSKKLGLEKPFYPLSQFLSLSENGHNAVMGKS